ncbi:hypothetical protein STSP2_03376 [Anaerohalosphaera lusitana]|uniref:Uncharacterized protein n=1 Tax=Anaerohalosphaera lusitana TaxID=1936003 RepID=A0A1U9NQG7_9BACT|nr:hypothetical protein [Anaerohalosphaera lusitana]AQT70171.1 hypothetical protein STSP2_03376 [Anaerohalosphaera lusitana]
MEKLKLYFGNGTSIGAPKVDGTSSISFYSESGDGWVKLHVNGDEKFKLSLPDAGVFKGLFDYKWLTKSASGEIVVEMCDGSKYKKSYKAEKKHYEKNGLKATYGVIENLGLHFVSLEASAKYLAYGNYTGSSKIKWVYGAGVWTNNISIFGDWYYNREAGDARGYLYNDRSPFGTSGNTSDNSNYHSEIKSMPGHWDPPSKPKWGVMAKLIHPTRGKWFVSGIRVSGPAELKVSARLGIGAAAGNGVGIKRKFAFSLPGFPIQ